MWMPKNHIKENVLKNTLFSDLKNSLACLYNAGQRNRANHSLSRHLERLKRLIKNYECIIFVCWLFEFICELQTTVQLNWAGIMWWELLKNLSFEKNKYLFSNLQTRARQDQEKFNERCTSIHWHDRVVCKGYLWTPCCLLPRCLHQKSWSHQINNSLQ